MSKIRYLDTNEFANKYGSRPNYEDPKCVFHEGRNYLEIKKITKEYGFIQRVIWVVFYSALAIATLGLYIVDDGVAKKRLMRGLSGMKIRTVRIPFDLQPVSPRSLKPIKLENMVKLWSEWIILRQAYDEKEFFINTLGDAVNKLFNSGISKECLDETIHFLEDPNSYEIMDDPYRLDCGHRLSLESLETYKKCPYDVTATGKPDVPLANFIREIKTLL